MAKRRNEFVIGLFITRDVPVYGKRIGVHIRPMTALQVLRRIAELPEGTIGEIYYLMRASRAEVEAQAARERKAKGKKGGGR
jgi:hypothetical protein